MSERRKSIFGRKLLKSGLVAGFLVAAPAYALGTTDEVSARLKEQLDQYFSKFPGSVLALQPFREAERREFEDGTALNFVRLNPAVNSWFLLEREPAENWGRKQSYHLENADPDVWKVALGEGDNPALVIQGEGETYNCRPWAGEPSELTLAQKTFLPYSPVCEGRLYLRNRVSGNRTSREAVSEFLRKNVFFGDSLVNLIKGAFYQDAFLQSSAGEDEADSTAVVAALGRANLDRRPVMRPYMGLTLEGTDNGGMEAGSWYAVKDSPGVYASAMQPGMIANAILSRRDETNWLDGVESGADVYLAAFDLSRFDVGYEMGTDHPALGWSSRPSGAGRNWNVPGPDGINSKAPLVTVGMVSPAMVDRVAATFTAGFKRDHGAFRFGPKATARNGYHYGFMTNGVILSRLHPELSTFYMTIDGEIGMKTWSDADNAQLDKLIFARQNGVPLIVTDPETGEGVPGPLVRYWGPGNWSGSAKAELRTVRGGACIREAEGRKILIYGYFSSHTPSAMARTFQAYGCNYAMLLDMNSQEHTYLSVHSKREDGSGLKSEHLVRGMANVDLRGNDGARIPRFVGYSDNRDFFYLLRKE